MMVEKRIGIETVIGKEGLGTTEMSVTRRGGAAQAEKGKVKVAEMESRVERQTSLIQKLFYRIKKELNLV